MKPFGFHLNSLGKQKVTTPGPHSICIIQVMKPALWLQSYWLLENFLKVLAKIFSACVTAFQTKSFPSDICGGKNILKVTHYSWFFRFVTSTHMEMCTHHNHNCTLHEVLLSLWGKSSSCSWCVSKLHRKKISQLLNYLITQDRKEMKSNNCFYCPTIQQAQYYVYTDLSHAN